MKTLPEIAVAQMRTVPVDVRANLVTMLQYIENARADGAEVIVFPELATSGYMLGDRWEHDAFIREVAEANEVIREASTDMTVIWGGLKVFPGEIGEDGRLRKCNAAFVAQNCSWVPQRGKARGVCDGWVPKTNMPKYRIFDDERHFYPASKIAHMYGLELEDLLAPFLINIRGTDYSVGIAVCEDLWEDEYITKVSKIYGAQLVDLLVDISQSPWTYGKWKAREGMLKSRANDARATILYVNSCGVQNNGKNLVWFDGASCLVDSTGSPIWRAPEHVEGLFFTNKPTAPIPERGISEKHDVVIHVIREFIGKKKKIVIGLSGGLDSAVSAALLVTALGARQVLAVNMPSEFNSKTTRSLAKQCAHNLGIDYKIVPISDLYLAHIDMLKLAGYPDPAMLVKENLQARIRGASVLSAIAAAEGGYFVCNGNKTEVALNYFTMYGDGAGVAAFLGDLWKGEVYELARYINERSERELIPQGIIDLVPSAELSAEQNVDEGKGDPIFYPYHDKLLAAFIEWRWDPTNVLEHAMENNLEQRLGCDLGTIKKYFVTAQSFIDNLEWAWRQYSYDGKRVQLPPVLLMSRRAFGYDRRDTIAPGYLGEKYHALRANVLAKVW